MKRLLIVFMTLFLCSCASMTSNLSSTTYQVIDNSKFHGDYENLVIKSARLRHKWNTIYVDEPVHTVDGWTGLVVLTHSGTFDNMYRYTIEPSGYVTFKCVRATVDDADRIKFKVINRKQNMPKKPVHTPKMVKKSRK